MDEESVTSNIVDAIKNCTGKFVGEKPTPQELEASRERLRAFIQEGLDSLKTHPAVPFEEVIAKIRAKHGWKAPL